MTEGQEHAASAFIGLVLIAGLVYLGIKFPVVLLVYQVAVFIASALLVLAAVGYFLYGGFCLLRAVFQAVWQ